MYLEQRAEEPSATVPAPIVLTPSEDWDGNDGKWSTFLINVGDIDGTGRGQNFRVLVSTSSSVTQVPLQATWCPDDECAERRGVEVFNSRQELGLIRNPSVTGWQEIGQFNQPLPDWWALESLQDANATYGWANVGLDASSPKSLVLPRQVVVANSNEQLFMGSFGLSDVPINAGGQDQSTFLYNFYKSNNIPSLSYGYTAGASYKNGKGTPGSLVLGGYDRTRFTGGTIIKMSEKNSTLLVDVQSITYHPDRSVDSNDYSFTAGQSGSFSAAIDSTLPYLWLPGDICDQFAEKFQLTYDEDENLYSINDTAHARNTQQKATVAFKIGEGPSNSDQATSITLPYDAFALEASEPIFSNTTRYFPIKKAPSGVFVLGRAFLQEAYIIVDHERNNFTVAPAIFSDPMPEAQTVSIFNTTYQPPQESKPPGPSTGGGGLSGGAIAGIVVGIVALLGIIAAAIFLLWKRKQDKKRRDREAAERKLTQEIDTTQAGEQFKAHRRISELSSEAASSPKTAIGGYYDRDKDISPFPTINEMESPPAELYSPPPGSLTGMSGTPISQSDSRNDYFIIGNKVRRRGATRESSGHNTPGTPGVAIAELPGDDRVYTVDGQHFEPVAGPVASPNLSLPLQNSRGPSDTSLPSNIDQVVSGSRPEQEKQKEKQEEGEADKPIERRPSHARGASDTTIHSDTTAVSEPTPEERDRWEHTRMSPRPLSDEPPISTRILE